MGGYSIDLQAVLNAHTAGPEIPPPVLPHHPLGCTGGISLHEDGHMECPHSTTWPHDLRARDAINHSIAILIIEEAIARL